MRILSILILTWVVAHLDQVSGKRRLQKGTKNKGPCGKPYLQQVNGKCYYVSTKKINWFGAQNNCLRKELNLADVATPEDFKAVTDYLKSQYGKEDYWIGGNDLQKEGKFSYISNGEPMNYMGEDIMVEPTVRSNVDDCLELRIRTNTTTIMDVNCRDKKYFVCENSQSKCVEPTADDENGNNHHSHEHLHHFHHDAGEKEQLEAGKADKEADESESRPLDNSNSTEIDTSDEKGLTEAGNETTTAVDTASEGGTTEAAAPTEEAKPTGEETKPTGEETKPTGEEAKPTGEETKPTGEEATAKEEATAAEAPTAAEEAKPKEEATAAEPAPAAEEAPAARTAPLSERN